MPDINYNNHDAKAAPTVDDFVPIWDVAASQAKKATIANLINARLPGGGIIATGGFTLTVPATGAASLLGAAQTYTALKTFSAGISLGADTLATYQIGTWTPVLAGDSTAGAHTYTTQVGNYVKIGIVVFAWFNLIVNAKGGTMAGNATITGLPFTVRNVAGLTYPGAVGNFGAMATNMAWVGLRAQPNTTTISLRKTTGAVAAAENMVAADIQNNTSVSAFLAYEASS